jgi:putative ABC transport system permease protein
MIRGRLLASMALRELRHSSAHLRAVLLILVLGFLGPLFSSMIGNSVSVYLKERSRLLLSGDIAVSALRPFKEDELVRLKEVLSPRKAALETEFMTMAKARDVAVLVEVKGVESTYPVFGEFEFQNGMKVSNAGDLDGERIAWVAPEVLAQLDVKVGDTVGIGKIEFRIAGSLEQFPGAARAAGIAPRIFIGRKYVEETGLTQFGSQVFHRAYFELPPDLTPETASARVKALIADPDVFLRTPDDSIQGFERFFSFFSLYLNSVTLILFVLSWMSAFYILQVFLQDRLKSAAVLLVNGASRMLAGALYAIETMALTLAAFLISSTAIALVALAAPRALAGAMKLPEGFQLSIGLVNWLVLALIAVISAFAFVSPFWVRLATSPVQALLGESVMGIARLKWKALVLSYGPLALVFLALSAWLVGSFLGALRITGGMLAAGVVGLVAGRALFGLLHKLAKDRPGALRLMATSLARSRFGVRLCFLTLVLVSLALNLVPHLLNSVVAEIQPLQGKEVPALFLFNIPESQVTDLQTFAGERKAELRFLSPFVLARMMKVNGEPIAIEQFQKFPVRVSYRDKRIPSESIIAGQDLPGRYDPASGKLPEISMEMRFAQRGNFKLGDVIEFDVQGVPVEGKITSLRRVRWTSFNPNFFMMFQPGVLDDAPKTFIANVNMGGGEQEKAKTQAELVRRFPDLSVIDIGRTIARVLEIARSVIGPIRAAAGISVVMSFLILIGVIAHNLRLRDREVDVEKLLGADASLIRRLIVGEYALTAIFAWAVGAFAAWLIAWILTAQVLEIARDVSIPAIYLSFAVVFAVTVGIAFVACTRVLGLRGTSRRL